MFIVSAIWHFLNGYVFKPINYGLYHVILLPTDKSWKHAYYWTYYWRFPSQIPELYQPDLTYWETTVQYTTGVAALYVLYHFVYVPLVNITHPWWDPYIP